MTEEEKQVSAWWNSVKDAGSWSGAIVRCSWSELWHEAQKELTEIYRAAVNGSSDG